MNKTGSADIVVRPVNESNLVQAIEIAVGIFGEDDREAIELEFRASINVEPARRSVTTDLKIRDLKFFIAFKNDQPVGVTGYYNIEGHEEDVWLDWIGVDEKFHHQGIGSVLVKEAFNRAAQDLTGIKNFRIWTTKEPQYDAARTLYRKLGFTEECYKPGARDAAGLIRVFSKTAEPREGNEFLWRNSAYPLDCDRYTIPHLNEKIAQDALTGVNIVPPKDEGDCPDIVVSRNRLGAVQPLPRRF